MAQLFIPTKIKIGFQNRKDTFTGKLAYVIYFDEKGKLRKEASWEGWRDKSIPPIELDNTPMSGYVLNKGIRRYSDWGSGRSVIRVHSPQEFEFEVSVSNLIGILMHSDVSKRDIQQECIFAWKGTELVLLPTNSEEYKESVVFTKKLDQKVSARDLVKGYSYSQKRDNCILTYIGHYHWYDSSHSWREGKTVRRSTGKKHVFYNPKVKTFYPINASILSSVVSEEIAENYSSLVDEFFKTKNSQQVVDVKIVPIDPRKDYAYLYRPKGNYLFERFSFTYLYSGQTILTAADNRISNVIYTIDDKKLTLVENKNENRSNYYNRFGNVLYNNSGPFEESLNKIAIKMGYTPRIISKEDALKVLAEAGFGKLVYVLENGTEINP